MYFQYGSVETDYLKQKDKVFGEIIDQIGHIDRETDSDLFSSIVHHIIGQQISTKAQATIWQRMRDALGVVDAEHILEAGEDKLQFLGISYRKAGYITDLAAKVQGGQFDLCGIWEKSDEEAIETILEAVKKAGYEPGKDFKIAMDAASSEWKSEKGKGYYKLPKAGTEYTAEELIEHWAALCEKYPIVSIEDGLDEEDWEGWQKLTARLGDKVQLVGDDLFVTNTERLAKGIELGAGNAILIKLNQIGSVSETLEAIKMAHKAGYTAISSHRSGETADTTIADLAVALNTCQIKTGAPSRSERVAKYNQLLRIEEELGASAVYPGMKAFNVKQD